MNTDKTCKNKQIFCNINLWGIKVILMNTRFFVSKNCLLYHGTFFSSKMLIIFYIYLWSTYSQQNQLAQPHNYNSFPSALAEVVVCILDWWFPWLLGSLTLPYRWWARRWAVQFRQCEGYGYHSSSCDSYATECSRRPPSPWPRVPQALAPMSA